LYLGISKSTLIESRGVHIGQAASTCQDGANVLTKLPDADYRFFVFTEESGLISQLQWN
jgi:hypothetical protein